MESALQLKSGFESSCPSAHYPLLPALRIGNLLNFLFSPRIK